MSILAIAGQFENVFANIVALLLVPLCAIAIAIKLGVHRAGKITGPDRLPKTESAFGLTFACCVGTFAWIGSMACLGLIADGPMDLDKLTPGQMSFLATVPPAVGILALLLVDLAINSTARLGLSRSLPIGAAQGLLGIFITLPLVMVVATISETIFQHLHIQHPMEHDLLKDLGNAKSQVIKILLVIAAVVLAPLFEELLFRGHLQTMIGQWLFRLQLRASGPAADDQKPAPQEPPMPWPQTPDTVVATEPLATFPPPPQVPILQYETPPYPPARAAWQSWTAVVITSLVFALLHPGWMRPEIFVLSLGLGYVYERTGNLWANITMHMAFNGFFTLVFIFTRT